MACVDAAYASALQFRSIGIDEVERDLKLQISVPKETPPGSGAFSMFFKKTSTQSEPPRENYPIPDFTPRAQQTMALARKEADRFSHNFVGTEHLLLGLIKLGQGTGFTVLTRMGVNPEMVRAETEKQVGTGPDKKMIGDIPYTPRVRKVLALAAREAMALKHPYVGTEHILLGLLAEGDGVAARVLKNFHVNINRTREEILKAINPNQNP
jgi:hypothetical protein